MAIVINNHFERQLDQICSSQLGNSDLTCYLQPHSDKLMRGLAKRRPTVEQPIQLFVAITKGEVSYCGFVVGFQDKRKLSESERQSIEVQIQKHQAERQLYMDVNGKACVNLIHVRQLTRLQKPFPTTNLTKIGDGKPLLAGRYACSFVRDVPDELLAEWESQGLETIEFSEPPGRVETSVSRIIRDTAMIRSLKKLHDHTCQLCKLRLELAGGNGYSEGHHLQPLGDGHDGLDVAGNTIIVCPNCHVLCDKKSVRIDVALMRTHEDHVLNDDYVKYHNDLYEAARKEVAGH